MSGGARHGIGLVIGLIVTPVIALCLMYGAEKASMFVRYFGGQPWSEKLPAGAALLVAAVLIGLVMGSRVSPLASVIPGLLFSALGLCWLLATTFTMRHVPDVLPSATLDRGFMTVGAYGGLLVIGVALLVASVPPSRWRSVRAEPRQAPQYMGPMGPGGPGPGGPGPGGPGPGGQGAPYPQGAVPQPQPYGPPPQQHQQPGVSPFAPPGAPPTPPESPQQQPFAAPGAPPAPPAAPEPPQPPARGSSASDEEQPGEWTQMYGGDDLRGGGQTGK
jgi:hypothetical protein